MGDNALIKIDTKGLVAVADVANSLINVVSSAIGRIANPWLSGRDAEAEGNKIRKLASANEDAKRIQLEGRIERSFLEQRAMDRLIYEGKRFQNNIENVVGKSLNHLLPTALPQDLDNDWLVNFLEKSKLISDYKVQEIWARILAGEVNSPGAFSRKTINILNDLGRFDAEGFASLCRFCVSIDGAFCPVVVLDFEKIDIYVDNGLNDSVVSRLEALNLIKRYDVGVAFLPNENSNMKFSYFTESKSCFYEKNQFHLGVVKFTPFGLEISSIVDVNPIDGFLDFLFQY